MNKKMIRDTIVGTSGMCLLLSAAKAQNGKVIWNDKRLYLAYLLAAFGTYSAGIHSVDPTFEWTELIKRRLHKLKK